MQNNMTHNIVKKKYLLLATFFVIEFGLVFLVVSSIASGLTVVHYYAWGWWKSNVNRRWSAYGVFGVLQVYDVTVKLHFAAEFVNVLFSSAPKHWIQVGWIKGVSTAGDTRGKIRFYIESNLTSGYIATFWGNEVMPSTKHTFQIANFAVEGKDLWKIDIDGKTVAERYDTGYNSGFVSATSESTNINNELRGHFRALKYYSPNQGWTDWDIMETKADPPYGVRKISENEFETFGPAASITPSRWHY